LFFQWEQEKACVPEQAVHQIAGMAKALELSYDNLEEEGSDFTKIEKISEDRHDGFPQSIVNELAKMGLHIC
jgi:cysteine desulfurase